MAQATIGLVSSMSTDAAGRIYLAEPSRNAIRVFTPGPDTVSTLVGKYDALGTVPGPLPTTVLSPSAVSATLDGKIHLVSKNALLVVH